MLHTSLDSRNQSKLLSWNVKTIKDISMEILMSAFKEWDAGSLLTDYSGQRCEQKYVFFFTLLFFVLREKVYNYGLCADKAVHNMKGICVSCNSQLSYASQYILSLIALTVGFHNTWCHTHVYLLCKWVLHCCYWICLIKCLFDPTTI